VQFFRGRIVNRLVAGVRNKRIVTITAQAGQGRPRW
jgi:hypothetical protein